MIGAQHSPEVSGGKDRINLSIVCGNKYAFRSMYVPVVQQLSMMASIRLYLLDYPEDYDINTLLQELHGAGIVESYSIIPSGSHLWRHHRVLRDIYRSVSQEKLDLLIVDEDSTPLTRYFIDVARSKHAAIAGLQKETPVRLLAAFESGNSGIKSLQAPVNPWGSQYRKLLRSLNIAARRPLFAVTVLFQQCKQLFRSRLNYWVLTLLMIGHKLQYPGHHKLTHGFPSTQVDVTIVYAQQFKKALLHFFPWLVVTVAQHPLTQNCRCKIGESQSKLLVVLSGPWSNWIRPGNPAESIEQRWCEAIVKAVELKEFSEVDIRPHPRETEGYPERLAQRLHTYGVKAKVVDARTQGLPEVICDYAGLISPPSSLLAEVAVSCKKGFVICLQDVEGENHWPSIRSLADGVAFKISGNQLTVADFTKLPVNDAACPTVCEVINGIMAERARLSREHASSAI